MGVVVGEDRGVVAVTESMAHRFGEWGL